MRQTLDLDSLDGLEAAVQDAHNDWLCGNFAAALEKYTQIVAARLSLADDRGLSVDVFFGAADMVVIERLADLTRLFGHVSVTEDLLAALSMLSKQSGDLYAADYFLVKRIDLLLGFGKLDQSCSLIHEMEPRIGNIDEMRFSSAGLDAWEEVCDWPGIQIAERHSMFSLLFLAMGRILSGYGQYADAKAVLKRGQEHADKVKTDLSEHINIQLKLAIVATLLEKGELEEARNQLAATQPELDAIPEPWVRVRGLELAGKINQLTGRLSVARVNLAEVVETCRKHKFRRAAVAAALNLAHVLILMNQTSVARKLLSTVRVMAQDTGEPALIMRAAFLNGVVRARSHSLAGSVPTVPAVSQMWGVKVESRLEADDDEESSFLEIPPSGNYLALFEDRVLEFYWELGLHDFNAAATILSNTIDAFELSDSELIRVRLRVLEGTLLYYQNEIARAERQLSIARLRLKELGLIPELWQTQRLLSWCWRKLNSPEADIRTLTEDTENLLSGLTAEMAPADQARFLLNKWTTEEDYIAGEINVILQMKAELQSTPFHLKPWRRWLLMKRLNALLVHIDNYKTGLARHAVQDSSFEKKEISLSLWRRLWSHPTTRVSVYFLILPDRVLWIKSGWLALDFGVNSVTRVRIRDLVQRWHLLVAGINLHRSGSLNGKSQDDQSGISVMLRNLIPLIPQESVPELSAQCDLAAKQIASALQIPLIMGSLPDRVRSLTFAPDDVLHGFPFAAARCGNEYLVERFSVSQIFVDAARIASSQPETRYAALVNVSIGSARKEIPPLPGTTLEIERISEWLTEHSLPVHQLSDYEASKSAVLEALSGASLFHIACHGKFEPNRPDSSGLVLIPDESQIEILSFRELSTLDLSGVQHATLSSCWSADNFILPGRWIISLPETLCRAGARSVLSSLWAVNDRVATSFMIRFYEYLNEYPKDEALRRTQLDCLQKDSSGSKGPILDDPAIDTTEPFYWASYTLNGDHRMLKL